MAWLIWSSATRINCSRGHTFERIDVWLGCATGRDRDGDLGRVVDTAARATTSEQLHELSHHRIRVAGTEHAHEVKVVVIPIEWIRVAHILHRIVGLMLDGTASITDNVQVSADAQDRTNSGLRVIVTGASGAVGAHVADRLAAHEAVHELIGVDQRGTDGVIRFDLISEDFSTLTDGADVLIHLAASPVGSSNDGDEASTDKALVARVLDQATKLGVQHVVLASSAMVYGAWPDNPVPLTEGAVVRPNPEFRFAQARLEIEDMGEQWSNANSTTLTILRAATTMARGRQNQLALRLRNSATLRNIEGDAPAQFLHAEDFAAAVETLVVGRHGGIYNVAPDNWLSASEVVALRGVPDTPVRVPGVVISAVSNARRRLGGDTHPGLTAYLQHPWVIANDKLKALGWEPEFSNAEAYVAGHQPSRFDGVTAQRRQELALGAAGATVAAGAVAALGAASWLLRRR